MSKIVYTSPEKRVLDAFEPYTTPYIPGEVGYPPGAPRKGFGQDGFRNELVLDGGFANQAKSAKEYFKQPVTEGGTKHDGDKIPLDLLDPVALEGLAKVLQFGAKKYAAHNWRGGISYSRLLAALIRHTFAILRGERIDPESGLPHIDHVGCCWMFASNMMKTRPDMDDLYYANTKNNNGSTAS